MLPGELEALPPVELLHAAATAATRASCMRGCWRPDVQSRLAIWFEATADEMLAEGATGEPRDPVWNAACHAARMYLTKP